MNSEKCTVHSTYSHRGAKCFYVSTNSQKSSSCCSLGAAIDLEGPVEAGGDQELGIPSKSHSCGESSVLTQNLEFVPLLAKVDAYIGSSDRQVSTAAVEAEVPHLVALIQLEGLEVLQFPQIPEFHTVVISSSGQVVTIL